MRELNKIDGLVGAREVGMLIDSHNQEVDKKKEKYYESEMNSRNKYFLPLWKRAIEEIRLGHKPTKKERKVYSAPTIYLPNDKRIVVK
jgi:hypothetical protein